MTDDLPTEFDLIVVGTGFTESVVAAAGSRVNKTVLHVDPNDFYGGYWASFNLENIQSFVHKNNVASETGEFSNDIENGTLHLKNEITSKLCNANFEWFAKSETDLEHLAVIPHEEEEKTDDTLNNEEVSKASELTDSSVVKKEEDGNAKEERIENVDANVWTKERVLKEFRKFNIDLTPKLLFSRGDLVELLISSNICRYAEFRAVDRVTTLLNGDVKPVPCSRSDVFTTKDVTVVEKRLLMKILSNCMSFEAGCEEFKEYEQKTFRNYLESKKLTPKLIHYILYAIGMSENETSCFDGVLRTKKFLSSLGRYGNTPFLFPMYGCGEIPQCFCRLSAVFGGIYCLKRPITEIHFKPKDAEVHPTDNQFVSIKCGEQTITGKQIVFGNGFNLPDQILLKGPEIREDCGGCGSLSRAIYITDKPIGDEALNSGGGGVIYLKLPTISSSKDRADEGAFVIQLSHFSGTCPKGLYLVHITTKTSAATPKSDIEPYEELIFKNDFKSNILWSLYFSIPSCLICTNQNSIRPQNTYISCGPYLELDYDLSIKKAKQMFETMYPGEEFLPRAPDPEEIVIEGCSADDSLISDLDSSIHDESIKEKIEEVAEGIENEVKCIEENTQNEDIDEQK